MPRRLSAALYEAPHSTEGGPLTPAHASFIQRQGVTAAWVAYMAGAFATDKPRAALLPLDAAKHVAKTYAAAEVAPWFFERAVPGFLYVGHHDVWNSTPSADALWAECAANVSRVYPRVREMGFRGLVYDNEADYTPNTVLPSGRVVSGFWYQPEQFGLKGNYYRRGRQIGDAIAAVWPNASIRMTYGYNWPGLELWVRGHVDAGLRVRIGIEDTYGAGPCLPGRPWWTCWDGGGHGKGSGHKTSVTANAEAGSWPIAGGVTEKVSAGLAPLLLETHTAQYAPVYFEQQLRSALCDEAAGPLEVWLWLGGDLTPASLANISGGADYLRTLHAYSALDATQEPLARLRGTASERIR